MKLSETNKERLIGLGLGFIVFIIWLVFLSGCYVRTVNVYIDDGIDDNRTIEQAPRIIEQTPRSIER